MAEAGEPDALHVRGPFESVRMIHGQSGSRAAECDVRPASQSSVCNCRDSLLREVNYVRGSDGFRALRPNRINQLQ